MLRFLEHTVLDTHTHTHTTGRTPLHGWSALRKGDYLHNTQNIWQTNINALSGIRTLSLDDQTAAIDRMATWSPISISWVRSHKGVLRTLLLNAEMWSISYWRSKKQFSEPLKWIPLNGFSLLLLQKFLTQINSLLVDTSLFEPSFPPLSPPTFYFRFISRRLPTLIHHRYHYHFGARWIKFNDFR
jgi:hypothetical protein